jgi:hypothetical protein
MRREIGISALHIGSPNVDWRREGHVLIRAREPAHDCRWYSHGISAWFILRYVLAGFFTVDQNERVVKTVFGRAQRIGEATAMEDPIAEALKGGERERYAYPQLRVIPPGGPFFKWPWEKVHKVSFATEALKRC